MQEHFTKPIITIYCLCDDFLQAWGHKDAPQAKMTTAQVMTVALVAATLFHGNHERSRCFLQEHGYIPAMLSKGNLNRRLHDVPEALWQALFALLAQVHQQMTKTQEQMTKTQEQMTKTQEQMTKTQEQMTKTQDYAVDSLPVPVCDNIRIQRCRLYPRRKVGDAFRGYIASKRRFFYGLRMHLVMTTSGLPVEVMLAPGAEADISAFRRLPLALPPQAHIFADAGYLDQHEQSLLAEANLHLIAQRRSNSRTPLPAWIRYIVKHERKRIETVFSQIAAAFGRTIHAVTARGFELKVFLTVLAFTIMATV